MTRIHLSELFALIGRTPNAIRERLADRKFRRLLRNTPLVELATMEENTLGRFVGRVRPLDARLMEAPLSGRLCVYYAVSIDAMVENGYAGQLAEEQDGMTFVCEAGGHRAVCNPAHAKISAGVDFTQSLDLEAQYLMTERQRQLLVRNNLVGRRKLFVNSVRFREAILEVDETITVIGAGVREPDPEAIEDQGGYREMGRTRLRMIGTAKHPLLISDDPRSR